VTDANLLLGRIRAENFLGGGFQLNVERTRQIVSEWLRKQGASLTLLEFASGVIRVVNATMERAIRVVSIERGYDPRDFTLVAFGGAGGLHACELAVALGIPRIIVPALPGALSAYGILVSDIVKDYSRTVLWAISTADDLKQKHLDAEFKALEDTARRDFAREGWGRSQRLHIRRTVDLRYRGQGFELNIPLADSHPHPHKLIRAFHEQHQRRYGYSHPGRALELVTVRLRALLPSSVKPSLAAPLSGPSNQRPKYLQVGIGGRFLQAELRERAQLRAKRSYQGPAVITEYSATTVVLPGMRYHVDRAANLVIE
jgi:N-methylhydantoinase A